MTKALLDALKDQAASQYGLDVAQAQQPFAELQGIKAGISGLSLPSGKEGTVKVSAGTAGTALLRSKRPMLALLDTVADEFVTMCPTGAVLLTEAQLEQVYKAKITLKYVEEGANKLAEVAKIASPIDLRPKARVLPEVVAGVYGLGFTLDTINSLVKLFRTNRQLDVFSADNEAVQMLGYLLESKGKGFVANPGMLGDKAVVEANTLLEKLRNLADKVQAGNDTLAKIAKYSNEIGKANDNDPIRQQVEIPSDEKVSLLKAEIENATSLLNSLHPSKKPDAFWAQVAGQVLSVNISGKLRLFIEAKAQTVQVTESRWYKSDRIIATGEVQVAYRLLNEDGSLVKSGVILKASSSDDTRIDALDELVVNYPKSK